MRQEFLTLSELLVFTAANPHSNTKAFCLLGSFEPPIAQAVAQLVGAGDLPSELLVDSDAIRHTFAQHGEARKYVEAKRGQIPIAEADILSLADWLPNTTS